MKRNRVLSSRKVWGGILASISIITVMIVGDTASIPTAILALGGIWGAVITGQAFSDFKVSSITPPPGKPPKGNEPDN